MSVMGGLFANWLSWQVPLAGPVVYLLDHRWISGEFFYWVAWIFFVPMMLGITESNWFAQQVVRLIVMWTEMPV